MRKRIASLMVIASLVMVVGCSAKSETKIENAKAEREAIRTQTETEGVGGTNDQIFPMILHVGYSTDATDPRGIAIEQFKKEVEQKTNKDIVISVHPSSEMGSDTEMIQKVITGDLDMTVSSAGNYATYATRIGVSALPFLFSDFDVAWKFMDSDIVAEVNKDLEAYNIVVLAHFDNGFRCVTTSEKIGPVREVSDMQGINIRTPDNQIVMETMSQLGANPRSFPFASLKDALKDGTFDAQENPIPIIYNHKLYEVQPYLSVTNHSYDAMPLSIRKDIWDVLPEDYQTILKEAAMDAQKTNREMVKKQTNDYVSLLENEGMTVVYPDLNALKEATSGVMDVFSDIYGEDLLAKVKAFK